MHIVRFAIEVAERPPRVPTVLVVSDDRDWRAVLRRVLEQEGYRVLAARHAGHALITCVRFEGEVDLLLSYASADGSRSDLPIRLLRDHPRLRVLELERRPRSREELVLTVKAALMVGARRIAKS
jgi:CheY-like chemotaxis protein